MGVSPPFQATVSLTIRNHALYALFPLISTDVLTPFIDLLEDALAQQVPPMVVSESEATKRLADSRLPSDWPRRPSDPSPCCSLPCVI